MALFKCLHGSGGNDGGTPTFALADRDIVYKSDGSTKQFTIDLSKKYFIVLCTCASFANAMATAKDGVVTILYCDKGNITYVCDESYTNATEPKCCYLTYDLTGTTLTITNHYAGYGEVNIIEVS